MQRFLGETCSGSIPETALTQNSRKVAAMDEDNEFVPEPLGHISWTLNNADGEVDTSRIFRHNGRIWVNVFGHEFKTRTIIKLFIIQFMQAKFRLATERMEFRDSKRVGND